MNDQILTALHETTISNCVGIFIGRVPDDDGAYIGDVISNADIRLTRACGWDDIDQTEHIYIQYGNDTLRLIPEEELGNVVNQLASDMKTHFGIRLNEDQAWALFRLASSPIDERENDDFKLLKKAKVKFSDPLDCNENDLIGDYKGMLYLNTMYSNESSEIAADSDVTEAIADLLAGYTEEFAVFFKEP
jgi:hypothetical protein